MRTWGVTTPDEMRRIVVVSPHLDDAVLGCSYLLAAHPGATVVTVFAGRPPEYPSPMERWDAICGFVEGDDIFSGDVDVVVTDGFTGNVALKTMEGAAHLIANRLRSEFSASIYGKLAGLVARPVLRRAAAGLDPRRYNGACMVGLSGIVVKSHGGADSIAFSRAVQLAAHAARRGLTAHIAQALETQRS